MGSLLVIFGYVVAMVPNFLFKHRNFILFLGIGLGLGRFIVVKSHTSEGGFDVGGFIYSNRGYFILVGLGFVLLFTLVCVVKVCYFRKGSLRPFGL